MNETPEFPNLTLTRFRNVMHRWRTTPDEVFTGPQNTLLANSLGRLVESLKSRNAGRGEWVAIKPVDKANQIDRRRDGQVLQVRFRQPHRARTAQVKGPYPLRNGCLNPCPLSISLLESLSTLELACSLECGMRCLWSDDECSAWICAR
jgi:hypothetical protein